MSALIGDEPYFREATQVMADLAKAETTIRMIKEWCGSVSTHDGRVKVDDILAIIDSGRQCRRTIIDD